MTKSNHHSPPYKYQYEFILEACLKCRVIIAVSWKWHYNKT